MLTYKAFNKMTPEYITQLLTPMSETHTLNLRSVKNGTLLVPLLRTKLFHDSFFLFGAENVEFSACRNQKLQITKYFQEKYKTPVLGVKR